MIPNIVHQIWMNPAENGKLTNPDYRTKKMMETWENNFEKYILWNCESMKEYIYEKDKKFLSFYNSLPMWINRCDIFRYFVLYHMGGIYADCDSLVQDRGKILEKLNGQKCVLIKDFYSFGGVNNFFMASEKKFEFMKHCYDNVSKNDNMVVHSSAGPVYLTKMYKKYPQNIKIYDFIEFPVAHLYNGHESWVKDQALKVFPKIFVISLIIIILVTFAYFIGLIDIYWVPSFYINFWNIKFINSR